MTREDLADLAIAEHIGQFTLSIAPIDRAEQLQHDRQQELAAQGRRAYAIAGGTFITYRGAFYILTAAHVWRDMIRAKYKVLIYKAAGRVFALGGDGPHPQAKALWPAPPCFGPPGSDSAEWGPDLALLPLPDVVASDLTSSGNLVAYNLERQDRAAPTRTSDFVVPGVPEEAADPHVAYGMLIRGPLTRRPDSSGFDYYDLAFDKAKAAVLGLSGEPASEDQRERIRRLQRWRGMSGGGLWHVHLAPQSRLRTGDVSLFGVAWRDVPIADTTRLDIRCHGPKSLNRLFHAGLRGQDRMGSR